MNIPTIAAIATSCGKGGIGIVKISGTKALAIATALFRASPRPDLAPPFLDPHRIHHGYIIDPDDAKVVDEVLLTVMPGPRSYTREDVVEINTHGSRVALQAVLDLVIAQGAAPAGPGEFTKRAFLNGRIDLSQAEAVMDIINARSARALQLALDQLQGGLKTQVESLYRRLLNLTAGLEAALDFSEDLEETDMPVEVQHRLQHEFLPELHNLLDRCRKGGWFRDGLKLVIVGPPNTGKSSLVNALLQQNRVIVSEYAGTTRDVVEALFEVDGVPVWLADTAGIHDTREPLECLGIDRTREYLQQADMVVVVCDVTAGAETARRFIETTLPRPPDILVLNKMDLLNSDSVSSNVPAILADLPTVCISARYRHNLDQLQYAVGTHLHKLQSVEGAKVNDAMMCNTRHKQALEGCRESLLRALGAVTETQYPELAVTDLRYALKELGNITGSAADALLIDTVFNKFCIGK